MLTAVSFFLSFFFFSFLFFNIHSCFNYAWDFSTIDVDNALPASTNSTKDTLGKTFVRSGTTIFSWRKGRCLQAIRVIRERLLEAWLSLTIGQEESKPIYTSLS